MSTLQPSVGAGDARIDGGAVSPSEVVLLHGSAFAPRARLGGEPLLGEEGKVSGADWMRTAYLAAAVANVQSGAMTLEHTTRKTFFKLFTSHDLFAMPAGASPAWPDGTLEARMLAQLRGGRTEVSPLYAALIGEETADAAAHGLAVLRAGLLGRGLLETRTTQKLRVFKTEEIVVPAATRALAGEAEVARVRRMLGDFETANAELFNLLKTRLAAAIADRTVQQEAPDFGSSD